MTIEKREYVADGAAVRAVMKRELLRMLETNAARTFTLNGTEIRIDPDVISGDLIVRLYLRKRKGSDSEEI